MGWLSLCSVMIVNRSFPRSKTTQKDFFYGSSDPIRLSLPLLPDPVFTADYKKMKLFQLSILWRAAEATGEFFSAVILPTHHRERLRQMLLTEKPGADHEYFCTMARLVASPAVQELQKRYGISIETGLRHAYSDATFVTNVFTGRPARALSNRLALEIGPILDALPDFPLPMGALAPLRAKAEQQGSSDFTRSKL